MLYPLLIPSICLCETSRRQRSGQIIQARIRTLPSMLQLSLPRWQPTVISRLAALAAIIGFCLVIIAHGHAKGHRTDTTAPYQGAKAALQGISPYSDAVTLETQRIYWGEDEVTDEHRFAYPAYSIFIFGWLTLLPLKTAYVVWAIVQFLLVIYALNRFGLSVFFATVLFFAFKETLAVSLMGQSVLWTVAWIALGLRALQNEQPRRAGLYFALSCIHPVLAIPISLMTLLYCGRALRAYVIIMLLWLLASLLVFGLWIPDWIITMVAYRGYVGYLNWIPSLVPASVPFSVTVLVAALLQRSLLLRHILSTSALFMLMPITGLYQLALLAPSIARIAKLYWLIIIAAIWYYVFQPLDIRRFELLVIPALVVIITLSQVVIALRLRRSEQLAPSDA